MIEACALLLTNPLYYLFSFSSSTFTRNFQTKGPRFYDQVCFFLLCNYFVKKQSFLSWLMVFIHLVWTRSLSGTLPDFGSCPFYMILPGSRLSSVESFLFYHYYFLWLSVRPLQRPTTRRKKELDNIYQPSGDDDEVDTERVWRAREIVTEAFNENNTISATKSIGSLSGAAQERDRQKMMKNLDIITGSIFIAFFFNIFISFALD